MKFFAFFPSAAASAGFFNKSLTITTTRKQKKGKMKTYTHTHTKRNKEKREKAKSVHLLTAKCTRGEAAQSCGQLPPDERPFQGLLGYACVHVAMVPSWSVHHVAMWWSLHGLLGVWLYSHHAHLHRVLG